MILLALNDALICFMIIMFSESTKFKEIELFSCL